MEIKRDKFDEVSMMAITESKKVIQIEEFEYRITRDRAPIYVMGSAGPYGSSFGRRSITGSFVIGDATSFNMLDEENFEIHLSSVKGDERTRMILKDVGILEWTTPENRSRFIKYKASFVATPDAYMQPEKLKVTNLSWAKHLLEREY